jgi:hypothetical protein
LRELDASYLYELNQIGPGTGSTDPAEPVVEATTCGNLFQKMLGAPFPHCVNVNRVERSAAL